MIVTVGRKKDGDDAGAAAAVLSLGLASQSYRNTKPKILAGDDPWTGLRC